MTYLLTILFCVISFSFIAFSMDRHQTAVWRRALPAGQSRGFRIAGWCGLVLALRFITDHDGWAFGLVGYSGCTSLAAGLVFGGLVIYERIT